MVLAGAADNSTYSANASGNNNDNDRSPYDDFPVIASASQSSDTGSGSNRGRPIDEVLFSGQRREYCVCYVDMMSSTKIAAELSESQVGQYYSLFLNSMAMIIKNFGAKIIKNAGDALLFYFPATSASTNLAAFKDVMECGITMIAAHRPINAKLSVQRLPSLSYRISSDYGRVEVAKSTTSQSDDLFGSTMNLCAKINSKAPPNGMIIGNDLYHIVKSFDDYLFEKVGEYSIGTQPHYSLYSVSTKYKRNILNPFSRTSISGSHSMMDTK